MDTLTFIVKMIEHAAWPTAAVIICVVLKKPIEGLLLRLNKAKHKDTEFDFNPQPQNVTGTIENASNIADAIPNDPLGLISEAEQRIYDSLEHLNITNDNEKVKVLAKHHANLQIRSAFSEINNLIYGSQISLLQALNAQADTVEIEFFKSYYDEAKAQYPEFYAANTFESYVNFLKTVGLINTKESKYFITVLGRGFLAHLAETGSNVKRIY